MATTESVSGKIHDYCSNDPFGNFVVFPNRLLDLEGAQVSLEGDFDQAVEAISDPVFILDMEDGEFSFFYFRKWEDSHSILIGVKPKDDHFEASCFQQDPTPAQLSVLFKKAKQIH
jgi:hypothetical protein